MRSWEFERLNWSSSVCDRPGETVFLKERRVQVLPSIPIPVVVVVVVAGLLAAVTDVWKFKVHNLLTLPLILSGMLYHTMTSGASGLGQSVLGILLGFGLLLPLYVIGGVGAGDVKFLAALGAWLGTIPTLLVVLAGSVANGVYAVALLMYRGRLSELMVNLQLAWYRFAAIGRSLGTEDRIETEVRRDDRRRRLIPFTAMMTVGLIVVLLCVAML